MKRVAVSAIALMLLFAVQPVQAEDLSDDPMDRFKQYLNRMVAEVKKKDDPAEKRAVLDESLQKMRKAADRVKQMPGVDVEDKANLEVLEANLADKQAQLDGKDGYEQVDDAQLDRFADYVQQDLEQAQRLVISIGATTLALLIILLLLL